MPSYLSPGVYVEETPAGSKPIEGVGTSVAAFVGLATKGPFDEPTLVSNWTQFTDTFGDFVENSYLAHAVYGWFLNGGGNAFVVRIGTDPAASNGKKELTAPATAKLGGYTVATAGRALGKPVTVSVEPAGAADAPSDQFKLVITVDGKVAETHDGVTAGSGSNNVATKVNTESKVITLTETGSAGALIAKGTTTLTVPAPEPVTPSLDDLSPNDYVGDAGDRTGFSGLEAIDEITMVSVPDLAAAYEQGAIDTESFKAVQLAMIAHCELMGNRVAILDTPAGLNAQQVHKWRQTDTGYDSKFATMYWPWVKIFDPSSGTNVHVPPSGHVAGVWARNDATRGVHKAPANEVIRGAIALQTQITKAEHDLLNPVGINAIRSFPGRGIRIWGARTLSSDPEWRYVNVRRLFNYIEDSILIGTQWVVFEPNDHALWARIRRSINAFLINEWRKGALFGTTPDEAFFVKCDEETNPAEGIDAGQVVCQIGIAPVKPAEFVVFQLSQFSGGSSLVNE